MSLSGAGLALGYAAHEVGFIRRPVNSPICELNGVSNLSSQNLMEWAMAVEMDVTENSM